MFKPVSGCFCMFKPVYDCQYTTSEEKHTQVWQKSQDDLISGYQSDSTVSSILTDAIEYKQTWTESLDNRILWELENTGLFLEAVPDLTLGEDDEIMEELNKLQTELQRQVVLFLSFFFINF